VVTVIIIVAFGTVTVTVLATGPKVLGFKNPAKGDGF
jgi:hypothetical protein